MLDTPQEIVQICRKLYDRGYSVSTEGNVSIYRDDCLYITPAGKHKGFLEKTDICKMQLDGTVREGRPSSEWRMHAEICKQEPHFIRAIIHAHLPYALFCSFLHLDLNKLALAEVTEMLGFIPTMPYEKAGTQEFAEHIAETFSLLDLSLRRKAVLLEKHGAVTIGVTLQDAFNHMEMLEKAAQIAYYQYIGQK